MRLLTITFALAGLTLGAQSITGGLQTGLSLPVGDLKDHSGTSTDPFFGTHIGGHLDFALTSHHEVRAQLTYHDLSGSDWGNTFGTVQNNYKILQVGADWLYHFESPSKGWYSLAGASLNSIKNNFSVPGYIGSASQSGKLGVRGGGGYTFNQLFSLEGTLNQIFVDQSGSNGFGFDTATWVQVSAVFRFGR